MNGTVTVHDVPHSRHSMCAGVACLLELQSLHCDSPASDAYAVHHTRNCRPEFVNRVDEFIVFEPLIRSQIRDIVGLRASALVARVAAQHITLKLGDSALEYLAAKVCCPAAGAAGAPAV